MKKRILSTILAIAVVVGNVVCLPFTAMAEDQAANAGEQIVGEQVTATQDEVLGERAIETLISYIKNYGTTQDNGNMIVREEDVDWSVGFGYSEEKNYVAFLYKDKRPDHSNARIELDWIIGEGWKNRAFATNNPEWTGNNNGYASASFDMTGFKGGELLKWSFYNYNTKEKSWLNSEYGKKLNDDFRYALSAWDFTLKKLMGVTAKDLGFYSYENVGAKFSDFDFTYQVTGDYEVSIIRIEKAKKVVIPETVTYRGTEYKIVEIGDRAAQGLTTLETVIINAKLEYIGTRAFGGCSGLKKVKLNSTPLLSVGDYAFYNINKKTKFVISGIWFDDAVEMITKETNRKPQFVYKKKKK